MNDDKLRIGLIGVGAAGNKIIDLFDANYAKLYLNTSPQDLDGLENAHKDQKLLTKISTGGGAGGNIKLGAQAIIKNQEEIRRKVKLNLDETDFIFVVCGLGGGSGSLGGVAMVKLLSQLKRYCGLISTVPAAQEGTKNKTNYYSAMREIYELHKKNQYLRSIQFVSNEELQQRVLLEANCNYEEFWQLANAKIYENINPLYRYAHQESTDTFDPQDFKSVLMTKGCMLISSDSYDFDANNEVSLASKVDDLLRDTLFVTGEVSQGTDAVVVIERPPTNDTKQIFKMLEHLKEQIGNNIYTGVYDNPAADKMKLFLMVAGLPFPVAKIKELEKQIASELKLIKDKESQRVADIFELNMEEIVDYIAEDQLASNEEGFDFAFFDIDDEEELDFNISDNQEPELIEEEEKEEEDQELEFNFDPEDEKLSQEQELNQNKERNWGFFGNK